MLICKIHYSNTDQFKSMGNMRKVNFTDKNKLIEYLVDGLSILTDTYKDNIIDKLIFTYAHREGLANENRFLIKDVEHKSSNFNYKKIEKNQNSSI